MKFIFANLPSASLVLATLMSVALVPAADAKKRAKYTEGEVSDGGSVSGVVSFEGDLPADAVEQIAITKNNDVCGDGNREVVWVDVQDGDLRGSFLFIGRSKEGKAWDKPGFGE